MSNRAGHTCNICYDWAATTKLRPCGHVFCPYCVARMDNEASMLEGSPPLRCPLCDVPASGGWTELELPPIEIIAPKFNDVWEIHRFYGFKLMPSRELFVQVSWLGFHDGGRGGLTWEPVENFWDAQDADGKTLVQHMNEGAARWAWMRGAVFDVDMIDEMDQEMEKVMAGEAADRAGENLNIREDSDNDEEAAQHAGRREDCDDAHLREDSDDVYLRP